MRWGVRSGPTTGCCSLDEALGVPRGPGPRGASQPALEDGRLAISRRATFGGYPSASCALGRHEKPVAPVATAGERPTAAAAAKEGHGLVHHRPASGPMLDPASKPGREPGSKRAEGRSRAPLRKKPVGRRAGGRRVIDANAGDGVNGGTGGAADQAARQGTWCGKRGCERSPGAGSIARHSGSGGRRWMIGRGPRVRGGDC